MHVYWRHAWILISPCSPLLIADGLMFIPVRFSSGFFLKDLQIWKLDNQVFCEVRSTINKSFNIFQDGSHIIYQTFKKNYFLQPNHIPCVLMSAFSATTLLVFKIPRLETMRPNYEALTPISLLFLLPNQSLMLGKVSSAFLLNSSSPNYSHCHCASISSP